MFGSRDRSGRRLLIATAPLPVPPHPIGGVRHRQFAAAAPPAPRPDPSEPACEREGTLPHPAPFIRFGCMAARWGSFAIGMALMFAPLVVGYESAGAVVHDVAMGLLVSVATLAALEWPRARWAMALPALWLVAAGRASGDGAAAAAEIGAG